MCHAHVHGQQGAAQLLLVDVLYHDAQLECLAYEPNHLPATMLEHQAFKPDFAVGIWPNKYKKHHVVSCIL